jgi:hypothetical protein
MSGYCHWPAVVWPLHRCKKFELPEIVASYQQGAAGCLQLKTAAAQGPGNEWRWFAGRPGCAAAG